MLFAAINVARKLKVDPELALRASQRALPGARGGGGGARGHATAREWDALDPEAQLGYYARARIVLGR